MAHEDMNGLLSRREAAKRLGISYSTLSRLMAAGVISFYRIGWQTLFDDGQLDAYLESVTTSEIRRRIPKESRRRHARGVQSARA
jgi:excisionase family DNA binding protein